MTAAVRRALGSAFDALPPAHRAFYDTPGTVVLAGTAQVWRGRSALGGLLCSVAGLPAAGDDVPLTLTVSRSDAGERWTRRFGRHRYASDFVAAGDLLIERMGPLTTVFRLAVVDGRLYLRLIGLRLLGVPLPAWLRPTCLAVEATDGAVLTFDIPIAMAGLGPIIHYRGRLLPAGSD